MNVYWKGQRIALTPQNQLGYGGEGAVFKHGRDVAIKRYHVFDPNKGEKLKQMIADPPAIPVGKGTVPIDVVHDENGLIVGYVMQRINKGWEDLSELANKKYRNQFKPTTRMIARLFEDGARTLANIHASNYVVGDMNDGNEKFRGNVMLFLDVDAYQFGKYPCPVGTEKFLDPLLYRIDLSLRPVFAPENDWYSFMVIMFRSLLLTHPYGGTHKKVQSLIERAEKRITVLDNDVTYPTIALPPDLISDDLMHEFMRLFKKGERFKVPPALIQTYADRLVDCPVCGSSFPQDKKACPVCNTLHQAALNAVTPTGVVVKKLYEIIGQFVYSKVVGDMLCVIAVENGQAVLYKWQQDIPELRTTLGEYEPGTRYDIGEDFFISSPPSSGKLNIHLNNDANYVPLDAEDFADNGKPVFRATRGRIFRMVMGVLMSWEKQNGLWVDHFIVPVQQQQTWFTVRQDMFDKAFPAICGFFQVFREQRWFLYYEGKFFDGISLMPLEVGEVQKDVMVRFGAESTLILRHTQLAGEDHLHRAVVDKQGRVDNSLRRKLTAPLAHGAAYMFGALLHATDEGLVQDRDGNSKTFAATKGVIEEGDTIHVSGKGIIAVKQDKIIRLDLN